MHLQQASAPRHTTPYTNKETCAHLQQALGLVLLAASVRLLARGLRHVGGGRRSGAGAGGGGRWGQQHCRCRVQSAQA